MIQGLAPADEECPAWPAWPAAASIGVGANASKSLAGASAFLSFSESRPEDPSACSFSNARSSALLGLVFDCARGIARAQSPLGLGQGVDLVLVQLVF
jgi:hypothetical protein